MPSPPSNPQIPQQSSRTPAGQAPPRGPLPWRSLVLVTALFLGFCAAIQAPQEIGCWHMAAANEYWTQAEMAALQNDTALSAECQAKAFSKLEQALAWSPGELQWVLQRAMWNYQRGKTKESLADLDLLMNQVSHPAPILNMQIEVYQKSGRHEDAVKVVKELDSVSQTSGYYPSRGNYLNTAAYVRAVGKLELSEALKQADESVREAEALVEARRKERQERSLAKQFWQAFMGIDPKAREKLAEDQLWQKKDTRGFVHYQLGNYREALADLNPAAEGIKDLLTEKEMQLPKLRRVYPDARDIERNISLERRAAAVICYHRSLANEKLGRKAAAAGDLQRVEKWIGKKPDETLY